MTRPDVVEQSRRRNLILTTDADWGHSRLARQLLSAIHIHGFYDTNPLSRVDLEDEGKCLSATT